MAVIVSTMLPIRCELAASSCMVAVITTADSLTAFMARCARSAVCTPPDARPLARSASADARSPPRAATSTAAAICSAAWRTSSMRVAWCSIPAASDPTDSATSPIATSAPRELAAMPVLAEASEPLTVAIRSTRSATEVTIAENAPAAAFRSALCGTSECDVRSPADARSAASRSADNPESTRRVGANGIDRRQGAGAGDRQDGRTAVPTLHGHGGDGDRRDQEPVRPSGPPGEDTVGEMHLRAVIGAGTPKLSRASRGRPATGLSRP